MYYGIKWDKNRGIAYWILATNETALSSKLPVSRRQCQVSLKLDKKIITTVRARTDR